MGETASKDDEAAEELGEDHVCENLWDTCIKGQMNDIIVASLLCVTDSITHRKNSYELYGYDFMLSPGTDGKPKVWLIEVNSSPACDYSTPVTTPLVKKMMADTVKVMIDKRTDPDVDTGEWELLNHEHTTKVNKMLLQSVIASEKLEVCGSQIKPPKKADKKGQKKKKKGKGAKAKAANSASCDSADATAAAADEDEADADADDDED